jgi:transcriptional regulator with XRE-family HTH domain
MDKERESYGENVKAIIAKNLVALRKDNKLTQQELAAKLNYSDKAISRWEHAETLPDIETLCKVCAIYGVRFEYLLQREQPKKNNPFVVGRRDTANRVLITIIAALSVWIAAFVLHLGFNMALKVNYWMIFIWSLPVMMVVLLICNSIFFRSKTYKYIVSSFFMWTLLLSCYIQLIKYNMWMLFIIGAPVQSVIMLSAFLKPRDTLKRGD